MHLYVHALDAAGGQEICRSQPEAQLWCGRPWSVSVCWLHVHGCVMHEQGHQYASTVPQHR